MKPEPKFVAGKRGVVVRWVPPRSWRARCRLWWARRWRATMERAYWARRVLRGQ